MLGTDEPQSLEAAIEKSKLFEINLQTALPPTDSPSQDALFRANIAAHYLDLSLRPQVVQSPEEIGKIVSKFDETPFKSDLTLSKFVGMIERTKAILKGHFGLLSGYHSSYFFKFSRIGACFAFREQITAEMSSRFTIGEYDTIIAPVTAGGLLVQGIAKNLKAKFAFFDVDNNSRPCAVRDGYLAKGRTLVVNDISTTGEGIQRMLQIVRDSGGCPSGVALVALRGRLGIDSLEELRRNNCRVEVLFRLAIDSIPKSICPECQSGKPIMSSLNINR